MLALWTLLVFSLWGWLLAVQAKSSTGDKVLVVLEPSLKRDNFSTFFAGLEERGYDLTFRAPRDAEPQIIVDDVPQFAHVILFAPETKTFAPDITPQSLVELLSLGTNLLLALGTKQTMLTSLAPEFSLIPPPPGTPLLSHFPPRDGPASVIPVDVPPTHPLLTPNLPPVWFAGVPFALGSNPLLVPILPAPAESFAADSESNAGADALVQAAEKGGEGLWAGGQLALVAGFQALGGARATWVGGVELFGDAFAEKGLPSVGTPGNARFAQDVAAWGFQESLVLRIDRVEHHLINETAPPETYTINDFVEFNAYISRFDPISGAWQPYSGIQDLQMEFTMLDPHVRTALLPAAGEPGKYSVTFRVPDRHGVFKFAIDYKRKGWTHLHSATVVPVVPPRHDQYPRFLSSAWPYYAGAVSTSVGFFLFSALWLAGDHSEAKKGKGAKAE